MDINTGETEVNLSSPEKEKTKLNILVVEDNDDVREAIVELINESPVVEQVGSIEEAVNGQEAWDKINSNKGKFNVVLTDGQMPRMSGLDLVKKIRAEKMDIVVALISGGVGEFDFNKPSDIEKVQKEYDIDTALAKPITMEDFFEFMEKIREVREAKNLKPQEQKKPL